MDAVIRNGNVLCLDDIPGPATAEVKPRVREGWTIAMRNGRITWMGPDDEFEGDASDALDATGRLVTPGFVDPHTHLVYGGDRAFEMEMKLAGQSYMEILAAGGGIAYTRGQTMDASVADLVAQSRPRLDAMIQHGTTSLEAKSGYALATAGELRMLEAGRELEAAGALMRHTFLGAHAVPAEFEGNAAGYTDLVIDDMLPAVAAQGIATFCDVFVEENVFTAEQGMAIFEAARRHGLEPRLHADEIVNTGGAELAAKAGAVSADHLLRVSPEGIAAMADAGTIATLLPTVPLTLMRPEWAPARDFLTAGVPIALATDHNPNNPVLDMNFVGQLACYAMGMSPEQAWVSATWNSACAMRVEDDVGSLAVGKRADILVHDVADLAHWAYVPGRQTVQHVFLAGAQVR